MRKACRSALNGTAVSVRKGYERVTKEKYVKLHREYVWLSTMQCIAGRVLFLYTSDQTNYKNRLHLWCYLLRPTTSNSYPITKHHTISEQHNTHLEEIQSSIVFLSCRVCLMVAQHTCEMRLVALGRIFPHIFAARLLSFGAPWR